MIIFGQGAVRCHPYVLREMRAALLPDREERVREFDAALFSHIGFAISETAQSSIFYGLTGLHGAHVFVGLTLLLFATIRAFRGHFSAEAHLGVEVPGIYWHFVDVMWIIVYSTVYLL